MSDGGPRRQDGNEVGAWRDDLTDELRRTRARTRALLEPLPVECLQRQLRQYLSPLVWDVGHIANFEELWLVRALSGEDLRPDRDGLYDPLENPRSNRAELPLPSVRRTFAYLIFVREKALEVLGALSPESSSPLLRNGYVYRMVIQHEGQHQETMLQVLDVPEEGWVYPAAAPAAAIDGASSPRTDGTILRSSGGGRTVDDEERVEVPGCTFEMGNDDRTWAYDNERSRHEVDVPTFTIDRFPVTVRRWRQFIDDGGYRSCGLWSEEGWAWLRDSGHEYPQGWLPAGNSGWLVRRFGHEQTLDDREPVQHLSFWEAAAFAKWAGGRLPTEAEWEKAAAWDPDAGQRRDHPWGDGAPADELVNLGAKGWGPAPVGSFPAGASAYGVEQMLGDVYEWTSSGFDPYPGFEAFPYRQYSEIFFGGPYRVLRGASWATHPALARTSYRNWDLPRRRQLFAGVRVAWDGD